MENIQKQNWQLLKLICSKEAPLNLPEVEN